MKKRHHTRTKQPYKNSPNKEAFSSQKMMKLGRYLKNLREDLDMSLRTASLLSSISPAHLCKIEQGIFFKSIGIDVLIRLAHIYNIPLSSILEETELIKKTAGELPEFAQYLRAKYNLSPQAIRDLETAREVVNKKYTHKETMQLDLL